MAREQMAFQERMSSTAYQRAMSDMQAAGLKPMLALANQASTPGGSTATMQNEFGPAVSSALEARRARAEVNNLLEQNKKLKAETRLTDMLEDKARQDALVSAASAKALDAKLPGLEIEKRIEESNIGRAVKAAGWTISQLNPFKNMFKG